MKQRILITIIEIIVIAAVVIGISVLLHDIGLADDLGGKYVLCMDRVNIRMGASRAACEIGWLETGDVVYPDGKVKNGFAHCVGLGIEAGEGWVHKGYLVDGKPERMNREAVVTGRSRVMARKNVGGKRRQWLKPGGVLKVYWYTDEWCLTNCGYVQTRYLELDGE